MLRESWSFIEIVINYTAISKVGGILDSYLWIGYLKKISVQVTDWKGDSVLRILNMSMKFPKIIVYQHGKSHIKFDPFMLIMNLRQ